MNAERIQEMVRHFQENGMKLLFQTPANVADLFRIGDFASRDRLDFAAMLVDPTAYVTADYRHTASDLVLRVPWRAGNRKRPLLVTILIEHQSEPDRLMMLRLLEYMVQIWKKQVRDHVQ